MINVQLINLHCALKRTPDSTGAAVAPSFQSHPVTVKRSPVPTISIDCHRRESIAIVGTVAFTAAKLCITFCSGGAWHMRMPSSGQYYNIFPLHNKLKTKQNTD